MLTGLLTVVLNMLNILPYAYALEQEVFRDARAGALEWRGWSKSSRLLLSALSKGTRCFCTVFAYLCTTPRRTLAACTPEPLQ